MTSIHEKGGVDYQLGQQLFRLDSGLGMGNPFAEEIQAFVMEGHGNLSALLDQIRDQNPGIDLRDIRRTISLIRGEINQEAVESGYFQD